VIEATGALSIHSVSVTSHKTLIFKSGSKHKISKEQLMSRKQRCQKCNIQKQTPKAEPLLNNILKILKYYCINGK